jgi:ribosomal protein S18 acetylase RimI-like enzyme
MQSTFNYRTGSLDDFAQLKELGILSFSQYRDVLTPDNWEMLRKGLENEDKLKNVIQKSTVFVCEAGDQIIGVAYFIPSGNPEGIFEKDWCYIRRVGVHPSYQGKGIARSLTLKCIAQAKNNKEKIITLHTSEFMDAARHVYESLGFKKLREIDPLFGKRYWLYGLKLEL